MNKKIKILYLSASSLDQAEMSDDKEFRMIYGKLDHRYFELISVSNVQASDFQKNVLTHDPDIIHFSGHASADEIYFENAANKSHSVPKNVLVDFFRHLEKKPKIIFFNACRTADNLKSLKPIIDFVVATRHPVFDDVAVTFAAKFYEALSLGKKIKTAFKLAKNSFDFEGKKEEAEMYKLIFQKGSKRDKSFIEILNEMNQAEQPNVNKENENEKRETVKNEINLGKGNQICNFSVTQAGRIGKTTTNNN